MLPCRIIALNDDSESDSSSDDEPKKVAKEAEETIAVSEYMRALTFQKHNNDGSALILFRELLETQVLDEVSKNVPDNKLFYVKYNCYKNIGFIYAKQDKNDLALEFLLKAIELDDTDVFTLSKLGNLSLMLNRIDIAKNAFEKCLIQNPNHWPSGDGVLKILCLKEAYNEAYGWALNWYDKDPHYKYGLDVILEIRHRFNELGLEYMEKCWNTKFKDTHLKRTNFISVFPDYSCDDPIKIERADLTEFKIDELSWLTIGQFIINVYEKYNENILTTCYHMTVNDLLLHPYDGSHQSMNNGNNGFENNVNNVITDESNEPFRDDIFLLPTSSSSSSPSVATPPQNENNSGECQDQQTQQQQLQQHTKKPKSRRRGSDLSFLEQWGWHKNKNYVQKKKNQSGRNENDQTLNGYLRRIFAKHFNKNNFDNEKPYNFNVINNNNNNSITNSEKSVYEQISCDAFQCNTTNEFHLFINELKNNYFDLFTLIQKWPKYIAKLWEQPIPLEIQEIYMKIHEYYTKHYDLSTWNTLEIDDYQSAYRTTIFYLELFHDRILDKNITPPQKDGKILIDKRWYLLLNHVLFHSGFIGEFNDKEYFQLRKRLYWLQYCLASFQCDLNASIDSLHTLQEMLAKQPDGYKIKFPNQKRNNLIENGTIKSLRTNIERTIRLTNIRKLYNEEQHEEIVLILEESLTNLIISQKYTNPIIKITTQFEILLESLWHLERFPECLQWSEHCFDYSVNLFLTIPIGSHRQYEWSDIINYILTYIYQLIVNESILIVIYLKKYQSRLVQNLIKILSHQLDTTIGGGGGGGNTSNNSSGYDIIKYPIMLGAKNTNETPLINIKMPWIILQEIAQHDDDLQIPLKKRQQKLPQESRLSLNNNSNNINNNNMTNGNSTVVLEDGNENDNNENNEDEDEEDETLPHPIMLLFTAHEFLGNQKWCTKDGGQFLLNILDIVGTRLRSPNLEQFRDVLTEHLEQITYCLYGYPAKRVRLRHIEEHDSTNIDLTWDRSIQLFDIYRPDKFPEFNSYKNDSISIEMEQLLQRIIALIPNEIDPNAYINGIENYINGEMQRLPDPHNILPYRINCIYYLLADHYFKNRDFVKSVKYYVLDLTTFPNRFDSWAGIALSKASNIEKKLNSCDTFSTNEFLSQSEEALRCFERCFKIDDKQIPLWIEYGNFEYAMHSFCSRSLKQSSATLSMGRFAFLEEKKEQCLNIAYNCFKTVDTNKVHRTMAGHNNNNSSASEKSDWDHQNNTNDGGTQQKKHFDDTHDEKWLYHYMLGKIAEKRKKPPNIYLEHYIKSAKYLFESNATYPFKINYSNPQNLSIEALEIFYRITSCIVKYVEHNPRITKVIGKLILSTLKNLSSSPFALNQAKIDDNSINEFKRKLSLAASDSKESQPITKQMRIAMTSGKLSAKQPADSMEIETTATDKINTNPSEISINTSNNNVSVPSSSASSSINTNTNNVMINESRRKSSQSVYKIIVGNQKSESDSSSSDSSSSDESSSSDDNMEGYLDNSDIELIYRTCIKNLEECITRFPEHYKSIYRLATIYFNAPKSIKDLQKCKTILLNVYTTNIGLQINGLFYEKKTNNFFNGIWRIPPSEIDRPGSFSAHLSKCVVLLMEVLRLTLDHNTLFEMAVQLQRNPDPDKRYLKDDERKELYQQAISLCIKAIREQLKHIEIYQYIELLNLLLDIYRAHRTCTKYLQQKENHFSTILIDAYRMYISRMYSIKIPESINLLDLAIKLCIYESNRKKNCEKNMIPYVQLDQIPSFLNPAHVFATTMRQLEIQKQQHMLEQQQKKLQQQLEHQLNLQQQQYHQQRNDEEQQKKNEIQQQFEQQQQRLQILQHHVQQDIEMHQLVMPSNQQLLPTNLSMSKDNTDGNQSIINLSTTPALSIAPTTITATTTVNSMSNTRPINSPLNNVSTSIIPQRSITPLATTHSTTSLIRTTSLPNSSPTASTFTSTITTTPTFTPSTTTKPSTPYSPYSMNAPPFQPTQTHQFNQQQSGMHSSLSTSPQFSIPTSTMSSANAPRPRGRPPGRKLPSSPNVISAGGNNSSSINQNPLSNLTMSQLQSCLSNAPMDPATMAAIITLYSNPTSIAIPPQSDPSSFNNLLADYYKLFSVPNLPLMHSNLLPFTSGQTPSTMSTSSSLNPSYSSSSSAQITSSPSTKLPQLDMKTLIASAANKVATATSTGSTAVISVGSGQLSITPSITTTPKSQTASSSSSSLPSSTTTTNNSNDSYSPSQSTHQQQSLSMSQLRSPASALTITKESPASQIADNFSIPTNPYDYKYTNPRQQQNYQAYHSLLSKNQTTITLDSSRPSSLKRLSPTPASSSSPVAAKIPFRRSSCYPGDFPKSLSITPQLSNYSSSTNRQYDASQNNRDSNSINNNNNKRPSVTTTKSGPKTKGPKKSVTPGPSSSQSSEQSSYNLPGPLPQSYSHPSSSAAAAAAAALGTTITPILPYQQQNPLDYLSTADSLAVAQEYQRNIAMMNQYSDLMKTLPSPASSNSSSSYLEQFDNFINNSQTERMKQNIRQSINAMMTEPPLSSSSSSSSQPKKSNAKGKSTKKDIIRNASISPSSPNISLSFSPNSIASSSAANRNYVTPNQSLYQSMSPGGRDGQSTITSNNNNNSYNNSGMNSRMYTSPTPPHAVSSSALSPMGSSMPSNPSQNISSFTVPSPITVRSPKQSPVGTGAIRSSPSPTSMSSVIQHQPSYRTSPTKTLQEKLAERQKAIQQLELSGTALISSTRSSPSPLSSPGGTVTPYSMRHGNVVGLSSPTSMSSSPVSGPSDDNTRPTTTTTPKGSSKSNKSSRKSPPPCIIILD